jgi:hypothetical protein
VSDFGFVTMAANPDGVLRACALARTIRLQEPGAPVTLWLAAPGAEVPPGYFDAVRELDPAEPFGGARRYLNKLEYACRFAPYEANFFLDDDVLLVRPIRELLRRQFFECAVAINSRLEGRSERVRMNHLVPSRVIERFGVDRCRNVYGGGHMFFRNTEAARRILARSIAVVVEREWLYRELTSQDFISDELALMVVANEESLPMPTLPDFVDGLDLWQANQISLDSRRGVYRWRRRTWGERIEDVRLVHFYSHAKRSWPYCRELSRLTGRRQSFDRGPRGVLRRLAMRGRGLIRGTRTRPGPVTVRRGGSPELDRV